MADGFAVDIDGLQLAASGVTETLIAVNQHKVSDIDADKSAFGHDRLAGTVADFCDRWSIGVGHLAKDDGEIAERLLRAAIAYAGVDRQGANMSNGILRVLSGADPAVT